MTSAVVSKQTSKIRSKEASKYSRMTSKKTSKMPSYASRMTMSRNQGVGFKVGDSLKIRSLDKDLV